MCVGLQVIILLFDLTNILLFTKTLISPKVHYKLASYSSFLLILLLSLLVLVWFFGLWRAIVFYRYYVGVLGLFVDGRKLALLKVWFVF